MIKIVSTLIHLLRVSLGKQSIWVYVLKSTIMLTNSIEDLFGAYTHSWAQIINVHMPMLSRAPFRTHTLVHAQRHENTIFAQVIMQLNAIKYLRLVKVLLPC